MQVNTIEQIIFGYAIQYKQLASMVESTFKNSIYANCTEINLYIDLTKIIRICSNIDFDKLTLSANILNLCAHYKAFFNSGFGVYCNIYMIYSTGKFTMNKYLYKDYAFPGSGPEYWDIDADIKANREALNVICKYLNNVEYIETDEEFTLCVKEIAEKENPSNAIPNIVISKDLYTYQLPAIFDGFYIFRPKKSSGSDESFVVDKSNVLDKYQKGRHFVPTNELGINTMNLPFIMSLTGFPDRCIKTKMNFKRLVKILKILEKDGIIPTNYQALVTDDLLSNISKYTSVKLNSFEISCVYDSINILSLLSKLNCVKSMQSYHGKLNLMDPNGLNEIVDKYYNSMIDINTLCM